MLAEDQVSDPRHLPVTFNPWESQPGGGRFDQMERVRLRVPRRLD